MRIGVFGGTFDPPHIGHLVLAAEALDQLNLDKVLWVLAHLPPHKKKQTITRLEDRIDMVQAAVELDEQFEFSRVDVDRPGPHYTIDTIHILGEAYPESELIYLMGYDSLRDLSTWYRAKELVATCDGIGVMRRPNITLDNTVLMKDLPGIDRKLMFVNAPLLEISSFAVRSRIMAGKNYRFYLHPAIYQIVESRNLYRT